MTTSCAGPFPSFWKRTSYVRVWSCATIPVGPHPCGVTCLSFGSRAQTTGASEFWASLSGVPEAHAVFTPATVVKTTGGWSNGASQHTLVLTCRATDAPDGMASKSVHVREVPVSTDPADGSQVVEGDPPLTAGSVTPYVAGGLRSHDAPIMPT